MIKENKFLGIIAVSLMMALMIFATPVDAQKSDPMKLAQTPVETNIFSMGTSDGMAIFEGTFDSKFRTFQGEVTWKGSEVKRIGYGMYFPMTDKSGLLYVRFYDPYNKMDPGVVWFGGYDENNWALNYQGRPLLKGSVYQPLK